MKRKEVEELIDLVFVRQAQLLKLNRWDTDEYRTLENIKVELKKNLLKKNLKEKRIKQRNNECVCKSV